MAAVVLAAGQGQRMGPAGKLVLPLQGRPMVACVVDHVLASRARPVIVVVGAAHAEVRAALGARPVCCVDNPAFASGIARSIGIGVAAVPPECRAVLICLGDMPLVGGAVLDRLIAAYVAAGLGTVCVPTVGGRQGNPVLWDRCHFPELTALRGDTGARGLLERHAGRVVRVAVEDRAILTDVDTPACLERICRAMGAER